MTKTCLEDLTLEERASLTSGGGMFWTAPVPRLGLRPVNMSDGPMGVASTRVDERDISVLTPCPTALGASWDPDLVRRVGALVADEARARDIHVMLAPNLGIPRSPLAGRAFETFSEDPLLTGVLGAAWIEGLQSRGVGACAKHFVCNDSETQRDTMNAVVDERALREIYFPPFEHAVRAGAWGLMMAYNRVNGVHCVEHSGLIDVLKRDWGFDGFVVSDWFGTFDTVRSAGAGLDLEMPGPPRVFGPSLLTAVQEGCVPQARLDDAAARVLRLAERSGRIGGARAPTPAPASEAERRDLLVGAAAAGFVLLKNEDDLLPFRPERDRRIAVIGPNAAHPCHQGGTFAKIGLRSGRATPVEAMQRRFEDLSAVAHAEGVDPEPRLPWLPATPARDLGDGSKGMTVDYFAGHDLSGPPLASETRNANSLTWFGALPGAGALDKPVAVRASGLFTPEVDGVHTFHVGGTGSVRLRVRGQEVFRREQFVEPKDLMGLLKSGVADTADVPLTAGAPVLVELELLAQPGRAQGLWWGCRAPSDATSLMARAVEAAREADCVLLVVGETADSGVESHDRKDTRLPDGQVELIRRIAEANPRVAVIVNAAHAVDLSWADQVDAVMMTWFPGEEFGTALAEVVAGDREPGGRLPVTFAAREQDYPAFDLTPDANGDLVLTDGWQVGYRGFVGRGIEPHYGFGEGMGYSRFTYEEVVLEPSDQSAVVVKARVRNVGKRRGKEIVQVYVCAPGEDPPAPQLRGFATIEADPGEIVEASIPLGPRAFSRWDVEAHAWRVLPGEHEIRVGSSLRAARSRTVFATPGSVAAHP